jgi:hypothetical protein
MKNMFPIVTNIFQQNLFVYLFNSETDLVIFLGNDIECIHAKLKKI